METLTPAFKSETHALQSQLQSVEADCVAHRKLLDNLQKQVASVATYDQPSVSTITAIHRRPSVDNSSFATKCERCGKSGHDSTTSGAQWLRCRQCWKVGHLARCCKIKQCQCCGFQCHNTEECKSSNVQCWKCGETGHLQRMCPKQTWNRFNH